MSQHHLRHRKDNNNSSSCTMNETAETATRFGRGPRSNSSNSGLRYESMMTASPQQTGQVMKLSVSTVFLLLPALVQQWILHWRCLAMIRPQWKTRQLILLGRFLYKFDQQQSNNHDDDDNGNDGPTTYRNVGAPIDVLSMEVSMVDSVAETERLGITKCLSLLPSPHHHYHKETTANTFALIRIATFRKTYYFACPTKEEALVWIQSLHDARHESIRRTMGHAAVGSSYSTRWEYFDSLGRQAAATKERIRRRIENNTLRELEMSNVMDSGPVPRGYFG